jgi:hypothetical protein
VFWISLAGFDFLIYTCLRTHISKYISRYPEKMIRPECFMMVWLYALYSSLCYIAVSGGRCRDCVMGWTVWGSIPCWGVNFRTLAAPPHCTPKVLYNGNRVSFPGGKPAGAWRWTLTPICCRCCILVYLYFCLSSVPACHVAGPPLPSCFTVTLTLKEKNFQLSLIIHSLYIYKFCSNQLERQHNIWF